MTSLKSCRTLVAALGLVAISMLNASFARALTVEEIVKRGTVRIGVVSGSPPMGIVDEKGNPAGYDVDVATIVAGYLGVKAELVPLTPPSRIPALQTGKVDFLIATLAATPERARSVMFTMPYSAYAMVIFNRQGAKFSKLSDLAGKRISVSRGSSQEAALRKLAVPGTEIVPYEDDAIASQAMIAGQVDAQAVPETVATSVIKQMPGAKLEVSFTFFTQGNCMTTRLQDFELHQWLNNVVYFMKNSGELSALYLKWTGAPMPQLDSF